MVINQTLRCIILVIRNERTRMKMERLYILTWHRMKWLLVPSYATSFVYSLCIPTLYWSSFPFSLIVFFIILNYNIIPSNFFSRVRGHHDIFLYHIFFNKIKIIFFFDKKCKKIIIIGWWSCFDRVRSELIKSPKQL